MTSALFKVEPVDHATPIKKTWDVVLYSGNAKIGGDGINVYRVSYEKSTMQPFKTSGILHIDEIAEGVSMINTGPCRYIALNTAIYTSYKSSVVVAYTTEIPVEDTFLPVNLLCIGGCAPTCFIPTNIQIEDCKKLTDDLYSMKTEDKTYFIVVDKHT